MSKKTSLKANSKFIEGPLKAKVKSVKFVDFKRYAIWGRLMCCDLALSNHDGMSLYTKKESLKEILRHHSVEDAYDDFTDLIAAIKALPKGVLVSW